MFLKVFWLILFHPGLRRTLLLLVFVEIKPDKVVLDHKKSYLVYFENIHFLWFFHIWPIFAENRKKLKFSKPTKYEFFRSKRILSGIIYIKTSKSLEKSGPELMNISFDTSSKKILLKKFFENVYFTLTFGALKVIITINQNTGNHLIIT